MIKNKDNKPYPYPKEATPEQIGALAERLESHRQITGSDGRYDKPKPKKKFMEPIEYWQIEKIEIILDLCPYDEDTKEVIMNTLHESG